MWVLLVMWFDCSDARDDDFKDFNFSVCTARDMSEQEYELVHMPGGEQDTSEGNGGRAGGGPPFSGRGGNLRGRGRGGFRGGRGRRGM